MGGVEVEQAKAVGGMVEQSTFVVEMECTGIGVAT